jgi:DNA polymerase IV
MNPNPVTPIPHDSHTPSRPNPMIPPLMHSSFPRAILHVDGDAFFTSVEQALHPSLRGRPVVTGKERGIIACASYEAKALGIKRGVSLWDAKKICPGLVILPSDYESYSLFSKRMFEIMRRYTPDVEEYSIDEGFADLTGMRQLFRKPYPEIAADLQAAIHRELDLTVSIGLSLTKSLAKIGSDFHKPHGLTPVAGKHIHIFLQRVELADVWGLGPNRVQLLQRFGLRTAWDYVQRNPDWIKKYLHKPGLEIWHELRGTQILPVSTDAWRPVASVSKSKTFTSPSADRDFIYAKLIRNLESACIKLRRHRMRAGEITVSLRRKDYAQQALCARLDRGIILPQEITPVIRELFEQLYTPGADYRATGAVLGRLEDDRHRQYDLFDSPARLEQARRVGDLINQINGRYGKHRIFLGTGLHLADGSPATDRDEPCWRKINLLPGETARKRIRIPLLDIKV